jgi:hypothetical protein
LQGGYILSLVDNLWPGIQEVSLDGLGGFLRDFGVSSMCGDAKVILNRSKVGGIDLGLQPRMNSNTF